MKEKEQKHRKTWYAGLKRQTKDRYVFSEKNERAAELAEAIREQDRTANIIFAKKHRMGRRSESGSYTHYFLVGEQESENLRLARELADSKRVPGNSDCYVWAESCESEFLIQALREEGMRIRMVNPCYLAVYSLLEQEALRMISQTQLSSYQSGQIVIVIAGLGHYGTELLKALIWLCQIEGYHLTVHVFDKAEDAKARFRAICPDILSKRYNGKYVNGEAFYSVKIHEGIDVDSYEFTSAIDDLPWVSGAFTALGEDERNVRAAVAIRRSLERNEIHSPVYALMEDAGSRRLLNRHEMVNPAGQSYQISFFGGIRYHIATEWFSLTQAEQEAAEYSAKEEIALWADQSVYRLSMAKVLYEKVMGVCSRLSANSETVESSLQEKNRHRMWNAFMRTEGYTYSGSMAPESSSQLAKRHASLIPYFVLSEQKEEKPFRSE